MDPEFLSYERALSRLVSMPDRGVEVTLRGTGRELPLWVDFAGAVRLGGPVETSGIVGGPEAVQVFVGDVRLTLHPSQFVSAVHTPTPRGGWLRLVMGNLEIDFHHEE